MPDKTNPSVKKLLRVLVAGGVALAGVDAARADDQAAPSEQKAQKTKDQEKAAKDAKKAKADQDAKDAQKKKSDDDKDKKAAQSEGEGVKGW